MALHMLKLCVGADSIADLENWVNARVADRVKRGGSKRSQHVTRMVPKRSEEILESGSLYWVIRGQIAARQRLLDIEPFIDVDGIGRCRLWMEGDVVAVSPRPYRAFQGWRYLEAKDAPQDLADVGVGAEAMPEEMRRALGELGLL